MQFAFTEEQLLIREAVRELCAQHATSARVRAAIATEEGFGRDTWSALAAAGWLGTAVPAEHGGMGLGNVELAIVQQEFGRRLLPSPFLACAVLAARAIALAGTQGQRASLLPAIADGSAIATLAVTGESGAPGPGAIEAVLERDGAAWRLEGGACFVPWGHVADLLVVAAREARGGGVSLLALPADSPGVAREKLTMLDLTRPMARLRFASVPVTPLQVLGAAGGAAEALEHTLDLALIAVAAEQTGTAEGALEMTTEYAKQRIQFGRPIGSFQAVKHRLADMMVQVEACKSAVYYAACTADEGGAELPQAAALAKAWCSDAAANCTANAIQLHGGIGFTWEHDAHLYFKRARAAGTLFGSSTWHRERIAGHIGLTPVAVAEGAP
ncbi:MAG: acyl-CoA/acyl-ACP dehydrogenase [Proteobacteria bacterium]|nr:acyl-CoA/acyl-ACP dehydrogenase [Pseudomonadota bacterium]